MALKWIYYTDNGDIFLKGKIILLSFGYFKQHREDVNYQMDFGR